MPRPTKLTPALQQAIVTNLASGVPGEVAAAAAGVGASTYYCWKAKGERQTRGPYREFVEAVKRTEAKVEVSCAAIVRSAMPNNWQAAMTMLERRWPQRWARRDRVDVVLRETADRMLAGLGLDGISAAEIAAEAERLAIEDPHYGQ